MIVRGFFVPSRLDTTTNSTVAELYILLFKLTFSGGQATPGHGREGYYFAENGEYSLGQLSDTSGRISFQLGRVKSPEAVSIIEAERKANFAVRSVAIFFFFPSVIFCIYAVPPT